MLFFLFAAARFPLSPPCFWAQKVVPSIGPPRIICGIKFAVCFLMKILTLFLALFLTLLPESVPFVNLSQGQDVCLEVGDDVEEEAVIRLPQRIPKKILTTSEAFSPEVKPASIHNLTFHLIHFCFERQWLKACMLRL